MDVYSLKKYIIEHTDLIGLILEKTGFHDIDDSFNHGFETRCARDEGKNPTAVRVVHDTLYATCFSTNLKGDLITLVQDKMDITFPKAVRLIADIINFKDVEVKPFRLPFGGYYKKIMKLDGEEPLDIQTYSEEVLNQFEMMPNKMFLDDGISLNVQQEFKIGYDFITDRIVVPWKSMSGEICGLMGRLNKPKVDDHENKWFPILSFPKSKTLYGYADNYNSIQETGIVIINESEKATLQLISKGLPVGVSLGGSNLSEIQANHIKSLFPNKIIIALDEGLSEDTSYDMAKQLKMNSYYKNQVGYIFDRDNQFMSKGSKVAPADLDKVTLNKLIKQCTIWI